MKSEDTPFNLSEPWFSLGIMTPERLGRLRDEWALEEDGNPEHYRWRAFREFLVERSPLQPQVAVALYQLGEQDPDYSMGGAMMDSIIRMPECPDALLEAALRSERKHLVKLASSRCASGGAA
jgi:hypothetical protein